MNKICIEAGAILSAAHVFTQLIIIRKKLNVIVTACKSVF